MSKVIAVIGAGFGDEGKGLMTDYYSSKEDNAIVVRSNGGAQAGHTVTTPDGERRIFSHISSGTLTGTPTYLSEYFVANPLLLQKELSKFHPEVVSMMKIYAHPDVIITTPYDMLLNQRFEVERGDNLHGSVGVGFNETIERDLVAPWYTISMDFLVNAINAGNDMLRSKLVLMLNRIRNEYIPSKIDMDKVHPNFKHVLYSDELLEETIEQIIAMMKVIRMVDYSKLEDKTIIFEGAQGLMLDQDYGYFPHVTRSNCGMRNMREIIEQVASVRYDDIIVNYVTRAYTTRHGAGPLDFEDSLITERHNIIDKTNIENEWQGSLRFAPLSLDNFNSITDKDFLNYAPREANKVTTITCLDQLDGEVTWIDGGKTRYMSANNVRENASRIFNFGSYGPSRNNVIDFCDKR